MKETIEIAVSGCHYCKFRVDINDDKPDTLVFIDDYASTMDAMSIAGWYLDRGVNPAGVCLYFKNEAFRIREANDANYFTEKEVENNLALGRMFDSDFSYFKPNGFYRIALPKSHLLSSPNFLFRRWKGDKTFVLCCETFAA